MQAVVISLKQVRHHREQVKEARRLAQTITNANAAARLTEYIAQVEQLERQAKALRATTARTVALGAEIRDLLEGKNVFPDPAV